MPVAAEVRRLQALYPDPRGALLPVLHMAQDVFGYVSLEVQEYVAGLFGLATAHSLPHKVLKYLPTESLSKLLDFAADGGFVH